MNYWKQDFSFPFSSGTGYWTQGLVHVRQVLNHWATPLAQILIFYWSAQKSGCSIAFRILSERSSSVQMPTARNQIFLRTYMVCLISVEGSFLLGKREWPRGSSAWEHLPTVKKIVVTHGKFSGVGMRECTIWQEHCDERLNPRQKSDSTDFPSKVLTLIISHYLCCRLCILLWAESNQVHFHWESSRQGHGWLRCC